jgi:hypothetical protein
VTAAQGITTGVVAGTVERPDGGLLPAVQVTAKRIGGGLPRVVATDGRGEFLLDFLEPGDYELLVERLGYRPLVVTPVPVLPGRRLDVRVALHEAPAAVPAPDTLFFRGHGIAGGSRPGRDRALGEWEARSVPTRDGDLAEAVRRSSLGEAALEVEGLPAGLGRAVIGGIPFSPARQAAAPGAGPETLVLPLRALTAIEVLAGRPDVEWPGAAGGVLAATARGPLSSPGGEADAVVGAVALGDGVDGAAGWRAGARVGAPLAGDSAHAWVMAEAQQFDRRVTRWPAGADDLLAALGGQGLDVAGLDRATAGPTRRANLGGAFDWHFPGGLDLDVIALWGRAETEHLPGAAGRLPVSAVAEATDLLAAATATTPIGERLSLQLRAGYTHSARDHAPAPDPATGLGDATVLFAPALARLGGDPALPGVHERSAITAQGAVHWRSGPHQVKAGAGTELVSHDRSPDHGRAGLYLFGGAAGFAERTGVFRAAEGARSPARFSSNRFFGFAQNSWRVAPGLDVATGLRYEVETLPSGSIVPNRRWRELTGMDNTDVPGSTGDVSVVAGFDWDLQELHEWRVRGALSVQRGEVSPDALTEALTLDGRVRGTAAVGDVTQPVELGPRLTLLAPDIRAPLTTRVSLGLSRAVGQAGAVHLGAALRQTDRLPARSDLNRALEPLWHDQHGRPVFGEPVRVGALVAPEPGSGRRFHEFDAVTAIAATGSSTYWGVTAGGERHIGAIRVAASYTFSRTEDDWYEAETGGGIGAAHPFPGLPELARWTRATSDFDVPHRLSLAAEADVPVAPVTVGAAWQRASGRPFTPGLGPGVDLSGTGAGHDPAFVDDRLAGMDELIAGWECLRANVGRFVDRNACRLPDRSLLDAWAAVRLAVGGFTGELRVEALGLDTAGEGIYDTVLLQLDPGRELVTDPATGRVDVPLRANPRFGQQIAPGLEISRVRIALRLMF